QDIDQCSPETDEAGDAGRGQSSPDPLLALAGCPIACFHLGKLAVAEGDIGHRQLPRTLRSAPASRTNGSLSRMERSRALGSSTPITAVTRPGLAPSTSTCSPRKVAS